MNYPIQGLAIVGPIIFLVMAILTPIIGVFAGWKRAAYWGGGNFVTYFAGLLTWKLSSDKISGLLQPLIKKALESIKIDETQIATLVKSLVAPVFLLILFLVMNLILLICYYAFAKRCMRIGKFSVEKRLIRAESKIKRAKIAQKDPETIAALVAKKNKWENKTIKSVNSIGHKKWFNRTIGGISFSVAMLPMVLTIPQVITMATTSKSTRANSKFATKIYDFLNKANDKLSWMYYYDVKTTTDFDAGFALLEASTKKLDEVTVIVYNQTTGKYEPKPVSGETLMNILPDTLSNGMQAVVQANTQSEASEKTIKDSINLLSSSWNSIMSQASDQVSSLFQSENVTALLEPVIKSAAGDKAKTLRDDEIKNMFGEDSQFINVVNQYKQALDGIDTGITPLTAIPTTQTCIDNLTTSFKNFIKPADDATEESKELFNTKFNELINMFVYVA